MTGIFIQVRLDSTRLPGKALLPLAGLKVIEHALIALKKVPADYHVVLTDSAGAPELAPLGRARGFRTYIGPKDDVLSRYAGAVRHFSVDAVIRATGDNPLVDWKAAGLALEEFQRAGCDYFGFKGLPLGGGVEVVRARALLKADREGRAPYEREHVTPYLYRNPDIFRIELPEAPGIHRSPGRITMDTKEDYEYITGIFRDLYRGDSIGAGTLNRWLSENER